MTIAAHIAAASLKPVGQQGVWTAMRACRPIPFTMRDIIDATDIPNALVHNYAQALLKGGYIAFHGMAAASAGRLAKCYSIVNDIGAEAPDLAPDGTPAKRGRQTENLWRAMRILSKRGDWSRRELAIHAATEETAIGPATVESIIAAYSRAGYVIATVTPRPHHAGRYRLVHDTGPRPPVISAPRRIFDRNLNRWIEGPKDFAPRALVSSSPPRKRGSSTRRRT